MRVDQVVNGFVFVCLGLISEVVFLPLVDEVYVMEAYNVLHFLVSHLQFGCLHVPHSCCNFCYLMVNFSVLFGVGVRFFL